MLLARNALCRQTRRMVYEKLKPLIIDKCPFMTLPETGLALLDAFEGRRQLISYYFMWHTGKPAPEQCEGCTWVTS